MAFVPLEQLMDGFCHLIELGYNLQDKFIEFADKYLDYFYTTWIDGNYPPDMWNFYQFKGRTNNNYLEVNNFIHKYIDIKHFARLKFMKSYDS